MKLNNNFERGHRIFCVETFFSLFNIKKKTMIKKINKKVKK